jgi:hypothetical protein
LNAGTARAPITTTWLADHACPCRSRGSGSAIRAAVIDYDYFRDYFTGHRAHDPSDRGLLIQSRNHHDDGLLIGT